MSLQIVQNQQLKPIGDKVAIDTQLSTTSENAISNKAVTEEITRINSDLTDKYEWNLLGSVPSQQLIDFPTDYAEIQICITNANEPYLTYVYNFCKPFIQSIGMTSKYFGHGYYRSNTDYQSCQIGMNMVGCYLQNLSAVGTNYTSGCTLTVYYR